MQYTCNSCNLAFSTPEGQRSHMKSEWHRYNLKRRVAQLPPIDEELFNSKVSALSIKEDGYEEPAKKKGEKQLTKKELRRKEKEAIQEKKRQILREVMLAKMEEQGQVSNEADKEDSKAEKLDTQEVETKAEEKEMTLEEQEEKLISEKLSNGVEIPITTCLFCHVKHKANFKTVEENVNHMFTKHGLYIPEQKYLVDKEGLVKYLGEKIGLGNVCLCCSYQGRNIEAVREHMLIKRHMRLPYETEDEKLEISEFYDFSSTYDEVVTVNASAENDEDWEDVSDEELDASDDDNLPSPETDAIYQNGNELILPSGAVIGHRSLARYYRQNLPPERILSEGQGTVIAAETRHMLTIRDRQDLAVQKRAWSREKKRDDINDRRAAKFVNNQPHFRDQLLQ